MILFVWVVLLLKKQTKNGCGLFRYYYYYYLFNFPAFFLPLFFFSFLFFCTPLTVLPKIIPFYFDNPMNSGEAAQVTCLVSSGDLPLNITWSFGEKDISDMRGITTLKAGRKGSMLLIDTVSAMHNGDYTCTARNSAGSSNFTASLRINGNHDDVGDGQSHDKKSCLHCIRSE